MRIRALLHACTGVILTKANKPTTRNCALVFIRLHAFTDKVKRACEGDRQEKCLFSTMPLPPRPHHLHVLRQQVAFMREVVVTSKAMHEPL